MAEPYQPEFVGLIYGAKTISAISGIFPMFELSLDGLEAGIKKLLVK